MEVADAAVWQGAVLGGIVIWVLSASYLDVTSNLRSFLQPWVSHHVEIGTPMILQIQVINIFNLYDWEKKKERKYPDFYSLKVVIFSMF